MPKNLQNFFTDVKSSSHRDQIQELDKSQINTK